MLLNGRTIAESTVPADSRMVGLDYRVPLKQGDRVQFAWNLPGAEDCTVSLAYGNPRRLAVYSQPGEAGRCKSVEWYVDA